MARSKSLEEELLTDLTYYILLTLIKPNHGYGIMQEVQEISEGETVIGPASMYTILKKLVEAGLIEPIEEDAQRRKNYLLTEKGKAILKKDVSRRMVMVEHGKIALEKI